MPEPDLSTYSAEALVDAIIRLTHTADAYRRGEGGVFSAERLVAVREQRDLARAELLKRCEPSPRRPACDCIIEERTKQGTLAAHYAQVHGQILNP
jgi:hypothetical protein